MALEGQMAAPYMRCMVGHQVDNILQHHLAVDIAGVAQERGIALAEVTGTSVPPIQPLEHQLAVDIAGMAQEGGIASAEGTDTSVPSIRSSSLKTSWGAPGRRAATKVGVGAAGSTSRRRRKGTSPAFPLCCDQSTSLRWSLRQSR